MKRVDLTGKTFGELLVLKYLGNKRYLCRCSCGKEIDVATYSLTSGQSTSCGHNRVKTNLKGKMIGNWKVLEYNNDGRWLCECQCDKHTRRLLYTNTLTTGKSLSCGCQVKHTELLKDKPGDVYGEWTLLEPLHNGKWLCRCSCGTVKEVNTNQLHAGQSKSCGHSRFEARIDYKGKNIGDYEVLEYTGNRIWKCKCLKCGEIKEISQAHLKDEIGTRCCKITYRENLVGKVFGRWKVLAYSGNGKWICECSCEKHTRREIETHVLKSGNSKSCGCLIHDFARETQLKDLNGQVFGNWKAIEYVGDRKWKCENIKSHEIREIHAYSLTSGVSTGINNRYSDKVNIGDTFGKWTVIGYGDGEYKFKLKCQCSCDKKTIRYIPAAFLFNGLTKSCGCLQGDIRKETLLNRYGEVATNKVGKPREKWQIDALSSKELFEKYLNSINDKTVDSISNGLNITKAIALRYIHKYKLESAVEFNPMSSSYEKEIIRYIQSLGVNNIIANDRTVLNPYEVDIYLPDKQIGIEFDGTYWHSNIFKGVKYHQDKTLKAFKKGVQLIHIFEYEWCNVNSNYKIKRYLKDIICGPAIKIYARDTQVKLLNNSDVAGFIDENHLQGYIDASINIGCIYKGEIVGVMTFSKPRFDREYQFEIIRSVWKSGYSVIGGSEKIFKSFVNSKYNPKSILSYCNIAKFVGSSYSRLGFKLVSVTEPNYVWVKDNNVISRYKTTKRELVEAGLGTEDDTENAIMERLGYLKIYDCGNAKYIWNRE